jgi:hypothetical protein
VEVSSAQRSARGHFYKVEDANHMEVCKPLSKQDLIYSRLVQLIELCQQVSFHVKYSRIFLLSDGPSVNDI